MVRFGYTYLRTKFMVMVPTHGHDGAHHDCDHALMVAIPTELSHVTLVIYEKPPSRDALLLISNFYLQEINSRPQNCKLCNMKKKL